MADKTTEKKTTEEGARSLAVYLQQFEDGQFHEDASGDMHALLTQIARLAEHHEKVTGTLTIALKITARRNGTVTVHPSIKVQAPKAPRGESIMWLTKGNNLSPENPRQQKLPLRDVSGPKNEIVDPADERSMRNV